MQRYALRRIVLVLALAGCSADTGSGPFSPSYQMQATPFTGRCDLVIQPGQSVGPGLIRQLDLGECVIAHLGKSTFVSDRVLNVFAGTQTVTGTYTAANGDILYANGAGTNQMIAPGIVVFHADLTFEGGTGRFANATGSASVDGQANLVLARSHFITTGTIAY